MLPRVQLPWTVMDGRFLLLLLVAKLASQNPLSPDTVKLYHDITSGKGLYSPYDKITLLNVTNFKSTLFNESNSRAWVVEFYNSWCGHCHRFAPIWKSLAADISGWGNVIGIAAVDCSNTNNTPLCRDYEVMHYPSIKYFPVSSSIEFLGKPLSQGNVETLRHTIISEFTADLPDGRVLRPNLLPFSGNNVKDLWENVSKLVDYTVLVMEYENSYIGSELAFDLMHLPNIQTRIALSTNKNLILSLRNVIGSYDELVSPFVLVIDRNISITPINISLKNNDWRLSVYNAVKEFFMSLGILAKELKPHDIIDDEVPDISEIMQLMQIEDQIKKKLHLNQLSDVVFQLDLEGGLKYTLFHEIPSHKVISGNSMVALKSYVNVLNKYFPFRKEGMKFISKVYEEIYKKDDIGGSDFEALVSHYEKKYHSVFLYPQGWLGCRGSQPHYRGFPCSLWLIFHTLTVQAELHKNKYHDSDPKEVLHAMLGYVKHFFGCTDCSQHFQQMADSIDQDVHSLEGSILWLWKAHNKVNRRLQKDKTEDPKHPKVQFPTPSTCSNCSINGEFNDKNVLNFLRAMFHNISYLHLDELPPIISSLPTAANGESVIYNKLLYNRISNDDLQYVAKEETKSTQFTFNILDVSLCVVLYLFSIGIIILVCIKFFIKKGYRRKVYVYDLFHKV